MGISRIGLGHAGARAGAKFFVKRDGDEVSTGSRSDRVICPGGFYRRVD
jgi:hypothetical protein